MISTRFSPSARWCMGSHLVGSFQFQASVVKHVFTLPTLSRTYPLDILSFLGEYVLEGFLDLDIQKISNCGSRAEHLSEKNKTLRLCGFRVATAPPSTGVEFQFYRNVHVDSETCKKQKQWHRKGMYLSLVSSCFMYWPVPKLVSAGRPNSSLGLEISF